VSPEQTAPSEETADAAEPDRVPGLEDLRSDAVPFGPFLALAGVEALLFGEEIISRVSAVFDQMAVLL
jgi:hypothetical protein